MKNSAFTAFGHASRTMPRGTWYEAITTEQIITTEISQF